MTSELIAASPIQADIRLCAQRPRSIQETCHVLLVRSLTGLLPQTCDLDISATIVLIEPKETDINTLYIYVCVYGSQP
jgi:hypothetical protein